MKNIYKYSSLLLVFTLLLSCSDFLDETPDGRTIVDNRTKVRQLLASAYPSGGFAVIAELSSDNIVDEGEDNPNSIPAFEEMAYWKDPTLTSNDGITSLWEDCYKAISTSNLALESIKNVKGEDLMAEKSEALITRAYSHFVLVNIFSKHYNPSTANTDLGITYMTKSETKLNPTYERASVAEVYEKINADIEKALPNISDDTYTQPKYHFNQKAAYAFAARFNLYYGKWDKAIKYANRALKAKSLVNWTKLNTLVSNPNTRAKELMLDDAILLLQTDVSNAGLLFGAYYYGARINHTGFIADRETTYGEMPWGSLGSKSYNSRPFAYSANNYSKVQFPKIPYIFEVTDAVANIGYSRALYNLFTTDETLLVRAEAKIHLQNYVSALEDLNTFTKNFFSGGITTTVDDIDKFYNKLEYSKPTPNGLTQKKQLNPIGFVIKDKNQENMLHYVLQCRRLLTMHEGLRWFDIKRYGIEVYRFKEDGLDSYDLVETLTSKDKRKAIQLPQDVISSGITPNPR